MENERKIEFFDKIISSLKINIKQTENMLNIYKHKLRLAYHMREKTIESKGISVEVAEEVVRCEREFREAFKEVAKAFTEINKLKDKFPDFYS